MCVCVCASGFEAEARIYGIFLLLYSSFFFGEKFSDDRFFLQNILQHTYGGGFCKMFIIMPIGQMIRNTVSVSLEPRKTLALL